jgi:hypothetical protein
VAALLSRRCISEGSSARRFQIGSRPGNCFGNCRLNEGPPNAYEEGCCYAPSHIPGREPLLASRPDRWTWASLVNRSGRSNSFGHLVDRPRLRLPGIADPLANGTAPPPGASCLARRPGAEKSLWRPRKGQGVFDHENRKTPISKPAANAHKPNVQAETTRTRFRRSSCGISWDRCVIAAVPLRWPLARYGGRLPPHRLLPIRAQKKAIDDHGGSRFAR